METWDDYLDKGEAYYKNGEYNEALKYFKMALDASTIDEEKGVCFCYIGISFGQLSDFEAAIKNLKKAADYGNETALDTLKKLHNIEYTPQKPLPKFKMITDHEIKRHQLPLDLCKAADDGDAESQYQVAKRSIILAPKGQKFDFSQNVRPIMWYEKAAEQGHLEAQIELGYLYKSGFQIKKDKAKAIKWFTAAANQGNAKAQNELKKLKGLFG